MNWISVKDRLPEGEQQVLIYYYEKSLDLHQIESLDYFKKRRCYEC